MRTRRYFQLPTLLSLPASMTMSPRDPSSPCSHARCGTTHNCPASHGAAGRTGTRRLKRSLFLAVYAAASGQSITRPAQFTAPLVSSLTLGERPSLSSLRMDEQREQCLTPTRRSCPTRADTSSDHAQPEVKLSRGTADHTGFGPQKALLWPRSV